MGEFEQVKPYTQVELDQQAIWANEFDQWWESEGQYHRAGGNEYCRTFAWWAWLNREQWQQSKIEQLEKRVDVLAEENLNLEGKCVQLEKRIAEALKILKDWDDQTYRDDIEQLTGELTDTLRGDCE